MPCLVQITASVSIYVYANDHAPPHFHVVTTDGDALVAIATLQIIRGRVRRQAYAAAVAWASDPTNCATLVEEWKRLNDDG